MSAFRKIALPVAAVALALSAPAGARATEDPMLTLATRSGCMQCHSVGAERSALDDTLPIGPSWQEVAAKYQGQRGAARHLARIVRNGTDPERVHWRGQVAGKAMPPNAVRISERDARRLARWILQL